MSSAVPLPSSVAVDIALQSAIDSIDDSFLVFDAEYRLVAFNAAASRMFPHLEGRLVPGATRFEDIVKISAATLKDHDFIEDAEAWLANRLRQHALPVSFSEAQLPNGRWARTEDRATPNGGRVVVTRDISDERHHIDDAARYTSLLRSTLDNISQGLCAFDR